VVNSSNSFAWMNPAVPEVRSFMIDLTLEAIKTHDLDIVQYDDRLAWPNEFGFDATTARLYNDETGRSLLGSPNDANFKAWRQSKVTLFATELEQAIDRYRPDLHTSVSPAVNFFSQDKLNADRTDWLASGLFDEYVPQVYRGNLADFRRDLPSNTDPFDAEGELDKSVIGLRLNGSGSDTPLSDYQQMIVDAALAEDGELAGHATFYSKGVIDNAAALTAFYGPEEFANPFFGPDHRLAAITATEDVSQSGRWSATVGQADQYRVIALVEGLWQEVDAVLLESGQHAFDVADASIVELLLDRRPIDGDTDFDRDVDLDDLQALADAIGGVGYLAKGDFDWNGLVNGDDLAIIEQTFGWGVTNGPTFEQALIDPGLVIPEPGVAVLLLGLSGATLARRRRAA